MTKDEILSMTKAAGIRAETASGDAVIMTFEALERFAALVAEKEREECAKVCDELHWPWHMGDNSGPKECANAIRAKGQAK
jgi:hypothetical protein